jgi:hypothetical protein
MLLLITAAAASAQEATWEVIQTRIFTPQCAGCHAEGTSFALQSDLILTADVAYAQLINIAPHNRAAREDGLVRVTTEGLPALDDNFLWRKINAPELDHFYEHTPLYGELMPLGMEYLTNGELEFIRHWLIEGAPENGSVVDTAILDDTSRYAPPEFEPPNPPAFGEQIRIGPFDVATNYEREFYYWTPRTAEPERLINRVQFVMRPGSHHFIFYTFEPGTPGFVIPQPGVIRDIRDANGNYIFQNLIATQYHVFFSGTQWPRLDYHFPRGVAMRLPAGVGLDGNSHYVNYTDQVRTGEIYANMHYANPEQVEHIADVLDLNNQDINLPPQQITTLTRTWTFNDQRSVFQLFSHAHQHMLLFNVYIVGGPRDGELVYFATDWAHPPILELEPPLVLEPNQGFRIEVTYDNWTDQTLHFGLLSEDEMMILFGYYYLGVAAATPAPPVASAHELLPNVPNPFNGSTEIRYRLDRETDVALSIYNLNGQEVAVLSHGKQAAGEHSVRWDARNQRGVDLPSGVYLCRLQDGDFAQTQKLMLLR